MQADKLIRWIRAWILCWTIVCAGVFIKYTSANWMYLGVVGVSPPLLADEPTPDGARSLAAAKSVCNSLPGLVAGQIEVCQSHPTTIASVSEGARKGIRECQFQFRNERWNCTTSIEDRESVFGYTLQRGSKETAFIYAVTSAGVVHAVTQACTSGNLTECSCDLARQGSATPQGWKWGGCSDNIRFGIQFARKFVDAPERIKHKESRHVRNVMNLHNNEAGRQSIQGLMRMQCRCHGVSGSCELKTCWRTIPPFSQVGDHLKKKYEKSVQIANKIRKRLKRKLKSKRRAPVSKADLVHLHKSPNYCVSDEKKGILGTTGRMCNKTSNGADGCDLLCCGRGYNTQVLRIVERCQCKFIWCCYVKCKTCVTLQDVHTCK